MNSNVKKEIGGSQAGPPQTKKKGTDTCSRTSSKSQYSNLREQPRRFGSRVIWAALGWMNYVVHVIESGLRASSSHSISPGCPSSTTRVWDCCEA